MTQNAHNAVQSETPSERRIAVNRLPIHPATLMMLGAAASALAIYAFFTNGYHRSDVAVGDSANVSGFVFASGTQVILRASDSSIWPLEDGPSGAVKAMARDGQHMCARGRVTSAQSRDKVYSLRLDSLQFC